MGGRSRFCPRCLASGHFRHECRSKIHCHGCKHLGHIKRVCDLQVLEHQSRQIYVPKRINNTSHNLEPFSYLNWAKIIFFGFSWFLMIVPEYIPGQRRWPQIMKLGIKSTTLMFGDATKQWISAFGSASIGRLALHGFNAELGRCSLSECHVLWSAYFS